MFLEFANLCEAGNTYESIKTPELLGPLSWPPRPSAVYWFTSLAHYNYDTSVIFSEIVLIPTPSTRSRSTTASDNNVFLSFN